MEFLIIALCLLVLASCIQLTGLVIGWYWAAEKERE